MKKKLSKCELLLLLTISTKADKIGFAQGSFDVLVEMNLIYKEVDAETKRIALTEKGQSFVKSLLKVKMPKRVWR